VAGRSAALLVAAVVSACAGLPNPLTRAVPDGEQVQLSIQYGNRTDADYLFAVTEDGGSITDAVFQPGCGSVGLRVVTAPFVVRFGRGSLPETDRNALPLLFESRSLPSTLGDAGFTLIIAEDGAVQWTPLDHAGGFLPDALCLPDE
jgi:hypothetical protein